MNNVGMPGVFHADTKLPPDARLFVFHFDVKPCKYCETNHCLRFYLQTGYWEAHCPITEKPITIDFNGGEVTYQEEAHA